MYKSAILRKSRQPLHRKQSETFLDADIGRLAAVNLIARYGSAYILGKIHRAYRYKLDQHRYGYNRELGGYFQSVKREDFMPDNQVDHHRQRKHDNKKDLAVKRAKKLLKGKRAVVLKAEKAVEHAEIRRLKNVKQGYRQRKKYRKHAVKNLRAERTDDGKRKSYRKRKARII